jgi:transposase InsO family protein
VPGEGISQYSFLLSRRPRTSQTSDHPFIFGTSAYDWRALSHWPPHIGGPSRCPCLCVRHYARPCDLELRFAVIEINADSAATTERRLAVQIAFPPPLRCIVRRAGAFHNSADRPAAPNHLIVVGVTIGFDLLYAFVIARLDRRDLVWINVTANPTAEWVARQITEAFPWDEAPRYLIRDRDRIYGSVVRRRLRSVGIRDRPTASASPWQNGFAERLIGSIRRECVDHIIVLGKALYAGSCDLTHAIITTSERIGYWTKTRRLHHHYVRL